MLGDREKVSVQGPTRVSGKVTSSGGLTTMTSVVVVTN